MSYHGKQYATVEMVCACGCGQTFYPVPKYHPKSKGGGKWFPQYIRGHHPSCRNGISGPAWNKGLTKGDHPSISRMGYQPGHKPFNDWSKINERLRTDTEFKGKWLDAKKGITAWNKGMIESPLVIWKRLVHSIYARDGFACVECGKTGKMRNGNWNLHAHHIIPILIDPSKIVDPNNVITLCPKCHKQAHLGNLPHLIQTD